MRFPQGTRSWCHTTQGETNASLTYLAPGAVLYPSATEGLYVFDLESGRTLSVWKPTRPDGDWAKTAARATLARGGSAIYLTDSSGNLRKIEARLEPSN